MGGFFLADIMTSALHGGTPDGGWSATEIGKDISMMT
jgi:hypothetical protein